MLHAGVVEMLVKEHFQLAVGRIAVGAGIVRKQGIRLYKCYFALQKCLLGYAQTPFVLHRADAGGAFVPNTFITKKIA